MEGIIFDLDQTLVDSSCAFKFRTQREWSKVYLLIPQFILFPGILESITFLNAKNIEYSIVTSSPRKYCNLVIEHFGIVCPHLVCYHDVKPHVKPHPLPILKGVEKLNKPHQTIFSFGDDTRDIIASNKAKVQSVACLWGATESRDCFNEHSPTHILDKSTDLLPFLVTTLENK
jgi:phosphoglycolate phosphatase-like HAD superfamily hydrolase